jgi:hypothetical protein
MKKRIQTMTAALLVFGALYLTASAQAQNATVVWGAGPQNISSAADVSIQGTLVDAFNLGPSGVTATTVNGVNFAPFEFPGFASFTAEVTQGNYDFTEISGNQLNSYNNLGTGSGAYSGLSAAYRTLLSSAGSATFADTLQLTISGLTIGQAYQFQWWDNNSSLATSPTTGNELNTIATADNSVTLDANLPNADGGLGQFAIGTFTANDPTQIINFDGDGSGSDPTLNAFQLRAEAVPEPATATLFGIGLLIIILKLRSRPTVI